MPDSEKITLALIGEIVKLTAARYGAVVFEKNKRGYFWTASFTQFKTGRIASVEFATIELAKKSFLDRIKKSAQIEK